MALGAVVRMATVPVPAPVATAVVSPKPIVTTEIAPLPKVETKVAAVIPTTIPSETVSAVTKKARTAGSPSAKKKSGRAGRAVTKESAEPADLVAFYRFDDGDAADSSGHDNDGKFSFNPPTPEPRGYEGGAASVPRQATQLHPDSGEHQPQGDAADHHGRLGQSERGPCRGSIDQP